MAYFRCDSGGGTIVDNEFTVLYTRDITDASSNVSPTISLSEDITEVILIAATSYDSTDVKVNSYSDNMTRIYSARCYGYYCASGKIWVFSKKKGQSASIKFTITGGRLIAR